MDVCSMILEGGSIDVDGEGTLLTTESCLLHKNRNPSMSREDIERTLSERLGIKKVVWLKGGLFNDDDTDGHVDNFARFCAPGKVLLHWTDDESDPQYELSRDALERLSREKDARGRPFEVVKLHQPSPLFRTKDEMKDLEKDADGTIPREEGERLPASYANFLIINGAVIFPTFGDSDRDADAKATLESCFPGRDVVGVPGREINLGGGGIHCITMQQPR